MKKKISASLLAMLLVFQVMSSGYLAPMAAFANEPVSTNETTDTQAPEQTAEQQAEAEAAQKKALEEAEQAVDDLFTDTTHKTIKEGLIDAQINTAEAYVDKLQDGTDKTKLQTLLAEARNQVAQAKTKVTKEETPKQEVATEETTKEETVAEKPKKKLMAKAVTGTEITQNIISGIKLKVKGIEKNPGDTIEPTASEIKAGFNTELTLDYTLPNGHGYTEGSTFTFNLPKNMEMYNLINETPLSGDPSFGTFNVTKDGKVTITFNKNIEINDNVKGQLGFTSLVKADLTQESEQDLVIQPVSGSTSYTFKLKYPKPNLDSNTPLTKTGNFIGNYNQKEANWNVEANNQAKQLENAVLEDVLPDGMEYVDGSLTAKEYKVLVDGNLSEVGSVSLTPTYDKTSRKLTIPLGKTNHVFKLSYKTKVIGDYKANYKNAAILKDDSTPVGSTVTKTVTPTVGKTITKSGKGITTNEENVKWEIQFNGKGISYDAGTYLGDSAFVSQTDNAVKVYEATIDDNGNWTKTATEVTGFTVTNGKLTFNTAITKPIIIEYQSKIPDGTASGATLSNTVNVNGETTTEFKATATNRVTGTGVTKTYGTPDYKNQLIGWTIKANTSAITLKAGAKITDEMPTGLTLQPATVVVTGIDAADYTINTADNKIELTTNKDVKSVITITFKTKFDLDDTGAGSATKYGYANTATFNYENKYKVTTPVNGAATFTPDSNVQANGYKKGVFDATTKTVEWTVDVNYNERTIPNAIVKDTLKQEDGFSIDQNKFKVVEVDTSKELVKDTDYNVTFGTDSKSYELTFKNSINKEYQIIYTTTDDDKIYTGSYTNTAELYNDTTLLTTLTKTVDGKDSNDKNTNFNNYIEKTGVQNTTNPDLLDWTIIVNKAESKLSNFKVTDTPKGLQSLKVETVKIVPEKGGTALKENTDYTLQYFKETGVFEIKFLKEINEAYKITYTTSFVAEDYTGNIGNEVKVTADGLTNADTNKTGKTAYRTSTAWGTSEGNLYKLSLHKKTNDANPKALAGITFNLYSDKDKKTLVDTETTNGTGDLTFYRLLKSKDYYLEEVNTPAGYVNPGLTKINFDTITNGEVKYDFINKAEVKAVKLTKTTNNGEKLAGVIFELKDSNGDNVEIDGKTEFTTDAAGEIYLGNTDFDDASKKLANGSYTFVEKKTVQGYKLDKTPIPFEVKDGLIQAIEVGMVNNACTEIEITFTGDQVNENKVYVVNQDGEKQKITTDDKTETKLDAAGKVVIPSKYGNGDYKIVLVQDGQKSIATPINSDDCKQTIVVSNTTDNACENTTITVKDGTKLVENARVVITDQSGKELFNGLTDSKGQITTKEYIALKDVTVKVYAKGYNTETAFKLSDEDCKAEVNLTPNACPDYAINVVDEKGDKITADGFLKDSAFTIKNQNNDVVATDVKINKNGQLYVVDGNGDEKIINKDELKNYATDTYTLVQTKTAPGYQTMQDAKVQDLDNCSGVVTINFNKTTEPTQPGVSCPYFTIIYKGPADSTAEFKLVKVTKDATTGEVTKTDGEKDIKVVTDPTTKVSTLDLKDTKSFEPGSYELVQTKGTSGYYNSNDIPFEVKMGECVAELTVTNTVVPPPACTNDIVVTVKDTEGKAVSTENAKVTVDGKETTVTGSNSQVTIPKTALDSSKEQTVIITLEDGRTTTVVLPANRVDCTANAVVPVLKVCEQDKTITIKDANGKDVPADKIVKVTVGDKEVTPKVENGKLVISKDLINPKEDTTITVTTKGGEQGFVTIPKYSETCDYTIVIQNACDAFTVNVTENGKKATTGNVSIVDADGKTVATEKVSANGTAKFPAKYADATYTVNVTIGKTTVTTPVNVNENCAVTVNVKTLACDEAAVIVTLDGKAQKGVKVSVVDSKGKVVQTVTTDAKGNAKIDPKYATKEYQVKVTVGKETKTVTMTSCNVTIDFKAPVTDGETEEPTEPGKPNKPTTPEKPSKPGVVTGGDTEENTNSSKPSKPGVKPGDHYDVYDKDGNLVASDVTVDKDGNISADLPPGEYDFVSKGEHVTAEVGKDGKLPQTGSSDFLLYTLAGIALLGASLVVFARGRKKSA